MKSGDIMAEIETDKATMEFEAVDEGIVTEILVAEGTDNVKVGTVIMTLKSEDDSDDDGERAGDAANAQPKEDQPADRAPPAPESNTPHQVETGARQMFEAARHDAEIADPAIPAGTEMVKTTLREALRDAMAEEMRPTDRVFVMGEEVAQYQGAYKVTQGLLDEFGDRRVIDTPDHRIRFCRGRHGAAMGGLRPIVEFMTFNFAMQAIDHIVNSAAKTNYMSGARCAARSCSAAQRWASRVGAQHSQNYAPWYASVPGLIVIAPYDAADAKGLLKAAIRTEDPVVFLENELLYGRSFEVPRLDDHACRSARRGSCAAART